MKNKELMNKLLAAIFASSAASVIYLLLILVPLLVPYWILMAIFGLFISPVPNGLERAILYLSNAIGIFLFFVTGPYLNFRMTRGIKIAFRILSLLIYLIIVVSFGYYLNSIGFFGHG